MSRFHIFDKSSIKVIMRPKALVAFSLSMTYADQQGGLAINDNNPQCPKFVK